MVKKETERRGRRGEKSRAKTNRKPSTHRQTVPAGLSCLQQYVCLSLFPLLRVFLLLLFFFLSINPQADRSAWAPYLRLLPTPADMRAHHPLFFGDATIASFEGSDVQAPLRQRRDTEVSNFALKFASAGGSPGRELEVRFSHRCKTYFSDEMETEEHPTEFLVKPLVMWRSRATSTIEAFVSKCVNRP